MSSFTLSEKEAKALPGFLDVVSKVFVCVSRRGEDVKSIAFFDGAI